MPISFSINKNGGFFISKYIGTLSDADLLEAYEQFFQGEEWSPGLNELVDLSEADLTEITNDGIRQFADYNESVYKEHNITSVKVAVYAPMDLPFGLARMYSVLADESPERVHVFRDIQGAESWLKEA